LKFHNTEVKDMGHLARLVGETPTNKKVKISVLREGKTKDLEVSIEKPKSDQPFEAGQNNNSAKGKSVVKESEVLGITVGTLDQEIRRNFEIDSAETGVIVLDVKQDAPAALDDVRPGDVIQSINMKKITNLNDFSKVMEQIKKEKRELVLLFIMRPGTGNMFVALDTTNNTRK
jgi:serine protease Do